MSDVPLQQFEPTAELFSALASPVRVAIVAELHVQPRTVGELVEKFGLSQPLVSQHLRVLRAANLVTRSREGRSMVYTVADEHVAHIVCDALVHSRKEPHDHDPS